MAEKKSKKIVSPISEHTDPQNANGHRIQLRRILIISPVELLVEGIKSLLRNEKQVEIFVSSHRDGGGVFQDIYRYSPDVIILDEGAQNLTPESLLASMPEIPQLKLVRISSLDDRLIVYRIKQKVLRRPADFIHVIADL